MGKRSLSGDILMLARHFETEKNVYDIHGHSELARITADGRRQLERLARVIRTSYSGQLTGIAATDTPQADLSARYLADETQLPYEGQLGLAPVNLGIAAGRSTYELSEVDFESFRSLDLFRARVINASELTISGAESVGEIRKRLAEWWGGSGGEIRCTNKVVIGSNSTVLMLSHLLGNILPDDPRYRYLAVPNGSFRVWSRAAGGQWVSEGSLAKYSWPETRVGELDTSVGRVAYTHHYPCWVRRDRAIVIVPGYFGSSRHGPYGLYSRLARAWAGVGYETLTVDPLGSGDSSSIYRDFVTEVRSVESVCRQLLVDASSLLIVGHSMGGATALKARSRMPDVDCMVWCLAPLCRLNELSDFFFTSDQVTDLRERGRTYRHGLELRMDMIRGADDAWKELYAATDAVWIGSGDPYTRSVDLSAIDSSRVVVVPGADHNFSGNDNTDWLISSTTDTLLEPPL